MSCRTFTRPWPGRASPGPGHLSRASTERSGSFAPSFGGHAWYYEQSTPHVKPGTQIPQDGPGISTIGVGDRVAVSLLNGGFAERIVAPEMGKIQHRGSIQFTESFFYEGDCRTGQITKRNRASREVCTLLVSDALGLARATRSSTSRSVISTRTSSSGSFERPLSPVTSVPFVFFFLSSPSSGGGAPSSFSSRHRDECRFESHDSRIR